MRAAASELDKYIVILFLFYTYLWERLLRRWIRGWRGLGRVCRVGGGKLWLHRRLWVYAGVLLSCFYVRLWRSDPSSIFEECFLFEELFFLLGVGLSFMAATPVRIAPIPRRISPKIKIDSSFHIRNTYIYKKLRTITCLPAYVSFRFRTGGSIYFYYVLRIVLKNYQEFFSWCICHDFCSVFNHQLQFGQSFPLRPIFFLVNNEFGYPPKPPHPVSRNSWRMGVEWKRKHCFAETLRPKLSGRNLDTKKDFQKYSKSPANKFANGYAKENSQKAWIKK